MTGLKFSPIPPNGVLVVFADRADEESLSRCRGLLQCLEERPPSGLVDVSPAYGEILVEFEEGCDRDDAMRELREVCAQARPLPAEESRLHSIPVRYDGPDLSSAASRLGLTPLELIERHSSPVYSVYMVGFSPGFPYLGPLDPSLHLPRLDSPRPKVPAGSVAIGGEHTGIYSIASPGGWHLIGRTETVLFSSALAAGQGNEKAFLFRAGDRVRFLPVG